MTQYLTREAIEQTLASIRSISASGSQLLFSYFEKSSFDPAHQSSAMKQHFEIVKTLGEPFLTGFEPGELGSWLKSKGFELLEDFGHEEQLDHYFRNRSDNLKPAEFARLAYAVAT